MYVACEERVLEEEDDEMDWDAIFEEFLLSEDDENMERLMSYLAHPERRTPWIYEDVLMVLKEHQSDRLIAVFTETFPDRLSVGDFDALRPIIDLVKSSESLPQVTHWSLAHLILAILKRSEDVPRSRIRELKDYVYEQTWPYEHDVWLAVLGIERHFNKLLQEGDTRLSSAIEGTETELGTSIHIEKLLIEIQSWADERCRALWPIVLDGGFSGFPYQVRKYLGDKTGIEPDLLDSSEELEEDMDEDGTGIIILPEE